MSRKAGAIHQERTWHEERPTLVHRLPDVLATGQSLRLAVFCGVDDELCGRSAASSRKQVRSPVRDFLDRVSLHGSCDKGLQIELYGCWQMSAGSLLCSVLSARADVQEQQIVKGNFFQLVTAFT